MRETLNNLLIVSRNLPVLCIEPRRTVLIQLDEAYRKQLHEFAGVILVGPDIVHRIRLLIPKHAQVDTH